METANLRSIINRQKEVLSELEDEYRVLLDSDPMKENALLKAEADKLRMDLNRINESVEALTKNAAALSEENAGLKNALHEQVYGEKVRFVNATEQKLDVYFRANAEGELNRLTALEQNVKARIDGVRETLAKNNVAAKEDFNAKLDELSDLLDGRVTEARAAAAHASGIFSKEEREELEALKNEQITEEQIRAVVKKNNLERFVGLNVLNAAGIFLLVVGAVVLAQFTYARLPDLAKGVMLFVLGGAMLAAGEVLNSKRPNVFSLGLSAGGVGILYAALAASYFGLNILGMYPAIAICVLITAAAFILSNRYGSQVIATFALIGGYLPMFSIGPENVAIYGVMVYFVALNILALLISFGRKWRVTSFIGLFLNIIGTSYIYVNSYAADTAPKKIFTVCYVFFAFLVYTSIPIVGTYRTGLKFGKPDVALLAVNTLFGSLIMYWVFYGFGLRNFHGLLTLFFAATYILLGRFAERKFAGDDRHTRALFYLTGLAFVVLVIPLQFGLAWLSLGWLAEGVLLAAYGILFNEKRFRRSGYVICLLCLGAFLTWDCAYVGHYLFVYKYLAVTSGSLVLLGAHMRRKATSGRFVAVYKYFALANAWVFAMYLILKKLRDALHVYGGQTVYQIDYLSCAAAVVATFLLAYAFPRIRLLYDGGMKIMSVALYAVGVFALYAVNAYVTPVARAYLRPDTPAVGITATGTAILVALGVMSALALRELLRAVLSERRLGVGWYPLIISGYMLVVLTQNLIAQFGLSFSNAVISVIYVLAALAWIIFGFARRYPLIRKFGLGLSVLSVLKLFLIDLASLTQGFQIISYFSLGATLVAISFVYQYFNKKLELKGEASADAEKGD